MTNQPASHTYMHIKHTRAHTQFRTITTLLLRSEQSEEMDILIAADIDTTCTRVIGSVTEQRFL